jgi:hypothetical protein
VADERRALEDEVRQERCTRPREEPACGVVGVLVEPDDRLGASASPRRGRGEAAVEPRAARVAAVVRGERAGCTCPSAGTTVGLPGAAWRVHPRALDRERPRACPSSTRGAPAASRAPPASQPGCRPSARRAVAAVRIGERDRDRHLAAKCGVCRLELDHFDNLLVRHELHEAAMDPRGGDAQGNRRRAMNRVRMLRKGKA